jgi:hypothetical protein
MYEKLAVNDPIPQWKIKGWVDERGSPVVMISMNHVVERSL